MAKKQITLYLQKPKPRLGEWLRRLRQERKLALREVAAAVGMDQAHLSKAELGQRLPTSEQANRLAHFFQVPSDQIEARRLAERAMQEIAASPVAAQALLILREESIEYVTKR